MSMVQNIINGINSWQDWYKFTDKVMSSNTYKHSWFVYADCFNEGETRPEVILGKGLTEDEARKVYEANKYGVENNGTDYAEIYMDVLYDPNVSAAPYIYERATGEKPTRAYELQDIAIGVRKKFKKMGL